MDQATFLANEPIDLLDRIIRWEARHLAGSRHRDRIDDLRQAGWLGALLAARRFDARRGVPFRHYARPRIRGAMLDELQRESRNAAEQTMDASAVERLPEEGSITFDGTDLRADVCEALRRLPEEQQQLVKEICTVEGGLNAVARLRGCPRRQLQRAYWTALRTLRQALDDYEPRRQVMPPEQTRSAMRSWRDESR